MGIRKVKGRGQREREREKGKGLFDFGKGAVIIREFTNSRQDGYEEIG